MGKKAFVLCLFLLVFTMISATAQEFVKKGDIPKDVPFTEVVAALAKPAVVQIKSTIKVSARIPEAILEGNKIAETGKVSTREATYFFTGSGFFATPDGYIVTNAHVVRAPEVMILPKIVTDQLNFQKILRNDDRDLLGRHYENTIEILKVEVVDLVVLVPIKGPFRVAQGYFPAEIKKMGGPYPEKDVAILKIETKDAPTLRIGDTKKLAVGAEIAAIGYPVAAEISEVKEATVTSGIVSAIKAAPAGWDLIQIDAAISPGSSGGPVFDRTGNVVGLATLKSRETQGFNWIVPAEIIKEFLKELNVQNQRSLIDQLYVRALVLYWNQRYGEAISELHKIVELYPNHPYAYDYLQKARTELETLGEARFKPGTVVAIAGIILLALVAFLFFFVLREKREIKRLEMKLKRKRK